MFDEKQLKLIIMAIGRNESAVAVKREFFRKVNVSGRAACKCGPIFSPEFYKCSKNATWQKQMYDISTNHYGPSKGQIEIDGTSSDRHVSQKLNMSESCTYIIRNKELQDGAPPITVSISWLTISETESSTVDLPGWSSPLS